MIIFGILAIAALAAGLGVLCLITPCPWEDE